MIIKVYSTPSCPWCMRTKDLLRKNNIKFEDIDVSRDARAANEMVRKSGQMGVPVIEVDGKIIIGFNEQKLKQIVKSK
jgi:glutaredoxin-like YruB-family protein